MATISRIERLGSGGFGEVWTATREGSDEIVVQKRLLDDVEVDEECVGRFRREVQIQRSLRHPNIVPVISHRLSERPYFYIMPLYKGNLERFCAEIRQDQGWRNAVISLLLDAVEYAHNEGVIHRDITQWNILFDDEGVPYLSDFGLGRKLDSESSRKSTMGAAYGTAWYAAPEQLMGHFYDADERADIYALGKVIYQLYTEMPFCGAIDLAIVDPAVRHVITKCLRQDPHGRYQTVAQLRRDYDIAVGNSKTKSTTSEISELLRNYVGARRLSTSQIQALRQCLMDLLSAPDELHSIVMELPGSLFGELQEIYPDDASQFMKTFCEHFANTGWGYSYCDDISDVVLKLIDSNEDGSLLGIAAGSLIKLGRVHNRYKVLDDAAKLVKRIETPDSVLGLVSFMESHNCSLSDLGERVSKSGVSPALIEHFDDNEVMDYE